MGAEEADQCPRGRAADRVDRHLLLLLAVEVADRVRKPGGRARLVGPERGPSGEGQMEAKRRDGLLPTQPRAAYLYVPSSRSHQAGHFDRDQALEAAGLGVEHQFCFAGKAEALSLLSADRRAPADDRTDP